MVPQKSRLPYKEFRARGYRGIVTPYFSIKARPNSLKKNRLGVIISATSIKSAARRNFWRRQVKSVFLAAPQKGFDLLVILRQPTTPLPKNVFRKALNNAIASLISKP